MSHVEEMMTPRVSARHVIAVLFASIAGASCTDSVGPVPTNADRPAPVRRDAKLPPFEVIVSNPVSVPQSAARTTGNVYVSASPGAVNEGDIVRIQNVNTGAMMTASIQDGGFDPVPVAADVGDTLAFTVLASTRETARTEIVVADRLPPRIVRTDPPAKKRDVPLNAMVAVVFSEPIDVATLNAANVRLLHGVNVIAGALNFSDTDHLKALFVPAAPLSPNTEYQLLISERIADLDGRPLEAPVTITFETAQPGSFPGDLVFVSVETGTEHSCALEITGAVYCWGANQTGQLGNGDRQRVAWSSTPVRVAGPVQFTAVTAGTSHACGLAAGGTAYCWGASEGLGAIGLEECNAGQRVLVCTDVPVEVAGGLVFNAISAGQDYTCGITISGEAYCWGSNLLGRLGTGDLADSAVPVPVAGGLRFTSISTGDTGSCAITTDGAAYCWGLNHWSGPPYAALGNGMPDGPQSCTSPLHTGSAFACSTVPVAVAGGHRFTSISTGWLQACGLTDAGTAYCWGHGPGEDRAIPAPLPGSYKAISSAQGLGQACAVRVDGQTDCWGIILTTTLRQPHLLQGGVGLESVSTSNYHSCGMGTDGRAYCWGGDFSGSLGIGVSEGYTTDIPARVAGQR